MADAKTEKQKVKEITDKLEEGLKELFESEKYKSYLSTMSKFHNYSFNNTLLFDFICGRGKDTDSPLPLIYMAVEIPLPRLVPCD